MSTAFASRGDLAPKKISFTQLADNAYAYTAEGDPNTGVVIGDDCVMVLDAQATPVMAQDVLRHIRRVTDKPVKHVVLSHYHAVRVLGASGYGAANIIASRDTYDLIVERGEQDYQSELERFPRLFDAVESVPGLTWPNVVFSGELTVWLGSVEVRLLQLGRGHTKGDTVAWLPKERVLFSGDLVEFGATPYTGDAYLRAWPATLDRLQALAPRALVPGRGDALTTPTQVAEGLAGTRAFITALYENVRAARAAGKDLKQAFDDTAARLRPAFGHWVIFDHCLPFDVSRAYDEAGGLVDPRIWTAARDAEMWHALAHPA
ncbi:MAG: MBL fold metallo-hydrolase [Gammaproteobacteria bacterium]|nr:MBL fold metallo-hydrolase [Gammaproteobacteria bacterium]